MATTEHKACLSTSNSPASDPACEKLLPRLPETELAASGVECAQELAEEIIGDKDDDETTREAAPRVEADAYPSLRAGSGSGLRRQPDWVLVFCYIIVYLELAWLILMLVRYSRH